MAKRLLVLFVAWFFLFAFQVRAEGVLVRTIPSANAEVSAFDGKVSAWFSGNVTDRATSLLVVDSQGKRVDNRDVNLQGSAGARSELSVTTGSLPPGAYVVRYRVLTRDGLVVSGSFRFTVKS